MHALWKFSKKKLIDFSASFYGSKLNVNCSLLIETESQFTDEIIFLLYAWTITLVVFHCSSLQNSLLLFTELTIFLHSFLKRGFQSYWQTSNLTSIYLKLEYQKDTYHQSQICNQFSIVISCLSNCSDFAGITHVIARKWIWH